MMKFINDFYFFIVSYHILLIKYLTKKRMPGKCIVAITRHSIDFD